MSCAYLQEIVWKRWVEIDLGSIASVSMTNTVFVLHGQRQVLPKLRLSTTTHSEGDVKMVRIPTDRVPTHPGEMLREEFLSPMGITQQELSVAIHVPYQRVNELVNGKRGVTPSTSLRLAKFFNMSPDFWMNLQMRWDLFRAQQKEAGQLEMIQPNASVRSS
jgi:addiction module HigA family antidote